MELIWSCGFLQSDADYWLLSDADVSITDMWRTERILDRYLSLHFILFYFLFIYIKNMNLETFCNFLDKFKATVEWNELNKLQEDYCTAPEHTTTPSHPSNIGEVSSASNPPDGWSFRRMYCKWCSFFNWEPMTSSHLSVVSSST